MKKIMTILGILCTIFGLVGCSKKTNEDDVNMIITHKESPNSDVSDNNSELKEDALIS